MSDEEGNFGEEAEFQITQREIEDLRRKEEELMAKMTKLASKTRSASDNSLNADEEEEEDEEEIGSRRRPTLSKGSSPSKSKRPDSLDVTLSYDSRSLHSRGSSTSPSPTKDPSVGGISPSKIPSGGFSSRSSSRGSTSPAKIQTRSVMSISSPRGSRSPSTSPVKSEGTHTITMTSASRENRSPLGSSEKIGQRTKSLRTPSPGEYKESKSINRSYSTPGKNMKELRQEQARRGSDEATDKSNQFAKNRAKSSDSGRDEQLLDLDFEEDGDVGDFRASSTGNLSNVEVPENQLIKRGPRGSRSSIESGKSRNSMNINEDSYEIIEIEDTPRTPSPSKRGKDNLALAAKLKIEQELAAQEQREEELRKMRKTPEKIKVEERKEDSCEEDQEDHSDIPTDEEPEDIFDEPEEPIPEAEVDEEQPMVKKNWSAKERIEQELAEQKLREEELRLLYAKKGSLIDADEEYRKEEDELQVHYDVFTDPPEESEDEEEDVGQSQLSTWEKIALEIEEEKKRDAEIKKKDPAKYIANDVEEAETSRIDTRSRINLEIEGLIRDEGGPQSDSEQDSGEASEEEATQVFSVQDRIEMEIKEIERREMELKKGHKTEDNTREDNGDNIVEEVEDDEGIDDSEFDNKTKSKIQLEIEEFQQKELELRMKQGIQNQDDSSSDGDAKVDTLSIIEREIAEQRKKEAEYERRLKESFRDQGRKNEGGIEREVADQQSDEYGGSDESVGGSDGEGEHDRSGNEDRDVKIEKKEAKKTGKEEFMKEKGGVSKETEVIKEDFKKEEVIVTQGITKKYIHMFSGDGNITVKSQTERPDQRIHSSNDESMVQSQQSHRDTRIGNIKANGNCDNEDLPLPDDGISADDDIDETEDLRLTAKAKNHESEKHDTKKDDTPEGSNIQTAAPGKKLVLKRKKTKKNEDREVQREESDIANKNSVADTRKSFEKQKESKGPKKAHPLAMHWEKLQEQHRNEASKNDIEAIRRKQEAEKRKKKELEERQERERLNKSLEIKELQDRRKSLAEAWEIKNNNNDEAVSPLKKNELTPSKSKKESSKTSPRKSPRKKKETSVTKKGKEETPKSARANIKLWEQMIASQTK